LRNDARDVVRDSALIFAAILAVFPDYSIAQEQVFPPGADAQVADESSFDRVWGHATLYENDDNGFVQKFALRGRLQADGTRFEADQGDFNDILWRRFRFGFKANLLQDWVLHVEGDWNLNDDDNEINPEESFNRLTDAYIGWTPGKTWGLKVLKQSAGFTLDGATSSTKLLTLQRNNLTNNLWFTTEYFTGLSLAGTAATSWFWKAAVFSSDVDQDLSLFEAGTFALLSLGGDFGQDLGLDRAVVRVDYVYNQEHEDAGTPNFSQVLSIVSQWQQGKWGLWTDVSAGEGYAEQSDLWGVVLMPFYDITPRTQLVLRYTWLKSADNNGVRLGRYEREIVEGRGDEYNEIYGGLNVFFYGHKLKWQTGLQYTNMNDAADDGGAYKGWGFTTGLRLSW
jgi:phosphate-selective porin OprO/OprP